MTRGERAEATLHAMLRASPNTKIKQFYAMIYDALKENPNERPSQRDPTSHGGDGPAVADREPSGGP